MGWRSSDAACVSHDSIERLARVSLLAAVALVLSYVETMIPLPVALPGVKLGLANIAVVVALFVFDARTAAAVALVKVFAAGFLFGSPMMLAYSVSGTALAFAVMALMRLIPGVSVVVVSMASAIFHNVGQVAVACVVLHTPGVLLSLPPLAVAACVTGALTGAVAAGVVVAAHDDGAPRPVVDLSGYALTPGEHVAFVGANGSGKTSAALQLAGLAREGSAAVDADVARAASTPHGAVPAKVGLAFQDPDDQIVASTVRDDVAFGLENRGVDRDRMRAEVLRALARVDAEGLLLRDVASLSGGQKQRVAIAGLLALAPGVMVFDESSAMLDPQARAVFERLVKELAASGLAVITVTQIMDEAFRADRIVVFRDGAVVAAGTPTELLGRADEFVGWGISLSRVAALAQRLRVHGMDVPLTNDEEMLEEALCRLCAKV